MSLVEPGQRLALLLALAFAMECAASKCANARWQPLVLRGMVHNGYVYGVAGIGGLANDDRNGKADCCALSTNIIVD